MAGWSDGAAQHQVLDGLAVQGLRDTAVISHCHFEGFAAPLVEYCAAANGSTSCYCPESFEVRVQPFELNAGVRGCELPVGFGVMGVAIFLPSGDLGGQGLFVGDAAIQTLG
jgi:hypothetical protein